MSEADVGEAEHSTREVGRKRESLTVTLTLTTTYRGPNANPNHHLHPDPDPISVKATGFPYWSDNALATPLGFRHE